MFHLPYGPPSTLNIRQRWQWLIHQHALPQVSTRCSYIACNPNIANNNNSSCILIICRLYKELLSLLHAQSHLVLITTLWGRYHYYSILQVGKLGSDKVDSHAPGHTAYKWQNHHKPGLWDSKIHAPNHDPKLPVRSGTMTEKRSSCCITAASYVTCQNQTHSSYSLQGPSSSLAQDAGKHRSPNEEVTE